MPDNPYASPAAEPIAVPDTVGGLQELPIASQGKRFLNLIIDSIVVQVMSTVAGFVYGIVFVASRMAANGTVTSEDEAGLELVGFVIGLLVSLGYFVVMEGLFQRTVGKLLTGTVVVREDGSRPSLGQVFGRSAARFIPFEAFSFLGGQHPVGWHDSLSGTRVISAR